MKLYMFCVRDSKTDQFGNPMFLLSPGQAIRSFTDEVNRSDNTNMMFQHPDDFELFALGDFDTADASFSCHAPRSVALGSMVKVRE